VCFIAFWRALPADFKSRVYTYSQRTKPQSTTQSAPNIKLSPHVELVFNKWKVNFLHFYMQIEGANFEPEQSPLAGVYSFLCQAEMCHATDQICKKLLYMVFFRLKAVFGRTQLRGNILTQFACLIRQSGLTDNLLKDIEKQMGT